jgi:hypothetical protein
LFCFLKFPTLILFSSSPRSLSLHVPQGDAGLDPQQEALICLKISDILSFAVLVQNVHIPYLRALEITADLTKIALKFSGPNITSAIACIAHISGQITRSPVSLLELAEKCFSSIVAIAKTTSTSTSTSSSNVAITNQNKNNNNKNDKNDSDDNDGLKTTKKKTKNNANNNDNNIDFENNKFENNKTGQGFYPPVQVRTYVPVTHAQAARIQRCLVVLGSICEQSKKCSDLFQFSATNNSNSNRCNKNDNKNGNNSSKKNDNDNDNNYNDDNNDDDDDGQTTYSTSTGVKTLGYGQKSRPITDEETAVADLADIGKVTVRNLNGCCYSACTYALSLPIPHVQARAVQSLCGVFVGTYVYVYLYLYFSTFVV